MFEWLELPRIELDDRLRALLEALAVAEAHAPQAVLDATGEELGEILRGIVPGLLLCLCVVAATTGIGAAGGAALGAFAAGIGAVPGAVLGAGVGLEAGVALLEILGLAFLAVLVGASLVEATAMAAGAVNEAWHANDDPASRWFHVDHAGRTLAAALGVFIAGLLQGLVAYLLARGTAAAAARVPELVAKLRASRLGNGFAEWVERSWPRLLRNEKLQPRGPAQEGGTQPSAQGEGAAAKSASAQPAATPEKTPLVLKAKPLPKGPPNPNARARGELELDPRASKAKQHDLARQNDSADRLAREGYDVERTKDIKPNGKSPDYKIGEEYADHVNIRSGNVDQARRAISSKVREEQADRIVARLDDTPLSIKEVQAVLERKPIAELKEVIFIKGDAVTSYLP